MQWNLMRKECGPLIGLKTNTPCSAVTTIALFPTLFAGRILEAKTQIQVVATYSTFTLSKT